MTVPLVPVEEPSPTDLTDTGAAIDAYDANTPHCQSDTSQRTSYFRRYKRLRTPHGRMPRQWLYDRCDGKFQPDTENRPPHRACWPPFIIKYAPDLLEQNCMCETIGRIGLRCFHHAADKERARRRMLWVCFFTNVIGLIFLILSALAISQSTFGLVWNFGFTHVWLEIIQGSEDFNLPSFFSVGLRAAAYKAIIETDEAVVPFNHFCDLTSGIETSDSIDTASVLAATVTSSTDNCGSCEDISKRIVPSLFLSMLGYIPNFTTDILRMYQNYDVNCQKFFASVFSWISLSTAIYTWVDYHKNCFAYMEDGSVAWDERLQEVDPNSGDAYLIIQTRYRPGFGEICLALASLLKIVDIICNIMLPTPSITRNHEEQADYEWKYGPGGAETDDVEDGGGGIILQQKENDAVADVRTE